MSVLLALTMPTTHADTIWLKNGDRISGTVLTKNNDRLQLETSYADAIAIRWSDIATLETQTPVLLSINGRKTPQPVTLDVAEDGQVICKICTRKIIALTAITALRNPQSMERKLYFGPRRNRH